MGKLTYDSHITAHFDDRVLAHLQLVVGAKLRRGESFYFSWTVEPDLGGGRSSIWMHPAIPMSYNYVENVSTTYNREWVEALSESANSAIGLQLVPEPAPSEAVPTGPQSRQRARR
ncbi:ATP-dependent DNA ligase [Cryobacterium melibiosiphilum]|uniref:ATP-dependent DNA ligase n=1 Tax=Cryobacterium melibiosiphilum TaxID=995039 RepID=A0A3A5MXR9_9MICO|nr:ATP-dependent DNA ligase [Cryobacterium melibiosiphilum]RJT92018.1 ATP-dependent DNA ligase [Cryobacterium melibiosiphilum]